MQPSTLHSVGSFVRTIPSVRRPLTVLWHAGEPLAVPISFYDEAFGILREELEGIPLQHCLQTNATLVNDQWCIFFKEHRVAVGVSLDGPKEIHDLHRRDRSGRGTFDRVNAGIRCLLANGVDFTVIGVVTSHSLDQADRLWRFYQDLGVRGVGLNIEELEGVHRTSSLSLPGAEGRYASFVSKLLDLSNERAFPRLREIDDMRAHIAAPPGSVVRRSDNRPGAIISIDCEGNVCTFSPELLGQMDPTGERICWGNVDRSRWTEVTSNRHFRRNLAEIQEGISRCKAECDYFGVCGGGCPSNKLAERGSFQVTETLHCRLQVKVIADLTLARLESVIDSGGSAGFPPQ